MTRIIRYETIKHIKTDLIIPKDVLIDIAYFLRHKFLAPAFIADQATTSNIGRGLDGFSAFYLQYYMRLETLTRHPNIVNLLYAGAHIVDTKIDEAVDMAGAGGQLTKAQVQKWWVKEGVPEWVINQFYERCNDKSIAV
jgi:hypothetical protein